MNGTIYDFGALPRLAFDPVVGKAKVSAQPVRLVGTRPRLIGLISNPRSHRYRQQAATLLRRPDILSAAPRTRAELCDVLADFAHRGIDLLAIDGGDGTIRDVLTCAGSLWGDAWPDIALLPSGKTNALAVDLGVPAGWTLDDAIEAAVHGEMVQRSPIAIERRGSAEPAVRGFLFGAGAFVDATELAQHTHRAGAFNGLAVALALTGAIASTMFGGAASRWRAGSRMRLRFREGAQPMHGYAAQSDGRRYMMLASTLDRLPVGLKPFGARRGGLKALVVDGPPRRLALNLLPLLSGSETERLERDGYHRIDADAIEVDLDGGFILDGEIFPGGGYLLRKAPPLRFITP